MKGTALANENTETPPRTRLDLFDPEQGLDRGRPAPYEAAWYIVKCCFFLSAIPWPSTWRCALLRRFGAKIGHGVVIKPRVNIHFPWKLTLADHVWIGEEACILNFEPVVIDNHVCISQRAFLCAGNHNYRDPAFAYRNEPITVGPGVWIGAQSFISPGTNIGAETVVTAGSVVNSNLPPGMICSGNPCKPHKPRWKA